MQAQTKAFPAAEGFGSLASGGRGGEVVEVTTLEDAATNPPEGSLRWALTQHSGKPLTVVFRVSGLIDLKAELRMKRNNVTIAGQTAPGDGICIMGDKVNLGGSNNVIVRHLRFRVGTMIDPVTGEPDVSGNGSLGYENASNWIIDHCTFGWSGEENMTIYDNKNTTIQWCILHEGLYRSGHNKGDRGYGSQWGGQNATFHHNLLAHNYTRSPRFNGARSNDVNVLIDYVNNVNYNWGKQNSCYGSDIELVSNRTNFVNNYYKPGPARPGNQNSYFTESSYGGIPSRVAVWYMNGNIMEGTANTAKNTDNYLGLDISRYPASATANPMQFRSETPFDIPAEYRVTTETAQEAFESVLAGAGAFPRDTVDRRVVRETREGVATFNGEFDNSGKNGMKGIIDKPEDAEGYPDYETYNTITDNDHDGMDDTWELANGLKPDDPDDRNLYVESGYTALEVYLNGLAGEIIEFQLATSVPPIQDRDWEIFQTRDGLHVTEGVTIEHIRIYNLSGQTFIHKNVNTSKIDISGLSRGIWLAEVITLNQGKRVLKFYK
ncbi:MAG: pectate lyase [Tannerella sp.]|nr:pectate lyase [Tannerella sp.]